MRLPSGVKATEMIHARAGSGGRRTVLARA